MIRIDLTGNWQDGDPTDRIRTDEPDVAPGRPRSFRQRLRLPAGRHRLGLAYTAAHDRSPGFALEGDTTVFGGLAVNGVVQHLVWTPDDAARSTLRATCEFELAAPGEVELALTLMATRPLPTRLTCAAGSALPSRYRALAPDGAGETALLHGIPFQLAAIDRQFIGAWLDLRPRTGLRPWTADGWDLACGDVAVGRIHVAGLVSSIDLANGSWYAAKGDHGYAHFVGDRLGAIRLRWSDGGETEVPLIYGFNVWYGRPWDILWHLAPYGQGSADSSGHNCDSSLFVGVPSARARIRAALHLVDGERSFGGLSNAARFIFTLDTAGRRIRSLRVEGDPRLHGFPLIGGVTLETVDDGPLLPLPDLSVGEPAVRPMGLAELAAGAWRGGVADLQRLLYASIDDLPDLSAPVIPPGYVGPRYDFAGPRLALYTASFLYHNGPECAAHIAASGTGCNSSTARTALTHYTTGMGAWRGWQPPYDGLADFLARYRARVPGSMPGTGSAWSRGIGELLREAMAFGYDAWIDAYVDWLDGCLFSDAQPPHWIRIVGRGRKSHDYTERQVGAVRETGNRENDGHGICMWGRYMVWHWLGRPKAWNERRWAATAAAADWICWQLESEALFPGAGKSVLFTESECAHASYDIYSSYNCLHGLKLYLRLAEQLGRTVEATRWRAAYERLRQGMLDHLVDDSPSGPIWHTEARCDWQDHAHGLVHLHLACEGDTFTPLDDYAASDARERRFLEISRSTYRHLMRGRNYDCLRMYGYGQGMMLQAALLLDEMADAERFLDRLVSFSHLPHLEGWLCPEGIIVHRDGRLYLPVNGYLGQDSHVADATKALRVMLGVDDNDPEHLRLVPRFPASWTTAGTEAFPMLTGTQRQLGGYTLRRSPGRIDFTFACERPVGRLSVRIGPLPDERWTLATLDGRPVTPRLQRSGDSCWAWFDGLAGGQVAIRLVMGSAGPGQGESSE